MAQPDMTAHEREKLIENWLYHITQLSLRISNHFVFIFERMLAGGNRPNCPTYGTTWPSHANGDPAPGNGWTQEEVDWIQDNRNAPQPRGIQSKMMDYSGAAFQRELFGGVINFYESEELEGPWVQCGYPYLN